MSIWSKIKDTITAPFVGVAVLIDEDRRVNEDGYWDKHWERKNRQASRREARRTGKIRP